VFDGPTFEGINTYYQLLETAKEIPLDTTPGGPVAVEEGALDLVGFDLADEQGRPTGHVRTGDTGVLRIEAVARRDIERPFANFTIATESGTVVYSDTNNRTPFRSLRTGERVRLSLQLPLRLVSGGYVAAASLLDGTLADHKLLGRAEPISFFVTGRPMAGGIVDLGGEFGVQAVD
jgi:hypothetical protein